MLKKMGTTESIVLESMQRAAITARFQVIPFWERFLRVVLVWLQTKRGFLIPEYTPIAMYDHKASPKRMFFRSKVYHWVRFFLFVLRPNFWIKT